MMDWLCPIFYVLGFLSLIIFFALLSETDNGVGLSVLAFPSLLFVGFTMAALCLDVESKKFYRESCFLYMAQTPSVRWKYENKDWKLVRINNDEIYLIHNGVQYKVTIAEDGGFYVLNRSDGKIKYAVSQNGDITSF